MPATMTPMAAANVPARGAQTGAKSVESEVKQGVEGVETVAETVVETVVEEGEAPNLLSVKPQVKAVVHRDVGLAACLAETGPVQVAGQPLPNSLGAVQFPHLLAPAESAELRKRVSALEYSFWSSNPDDRDFRNAVTVEVHDQGLAAALWERIRPHVPARFEMKEDDEWYERGTEGEWVASGINEHLLFAHYSEGGHFSPHTDGYTIVDFNHRSLYTVIVYLNDCGAGGATLLYPPETDVSFVRDEFQRFRWTIQPTHRVACEAGSGLVFFQTLPHEGEPVGPGTFKTIIRTDVMYRRVPPRCDDDAGRLAYSLYREAELLEADGHAPEAGQKFRRAVKLCPEFADLMGL
ncbi:uncharacterized protein MONBRDRAFT_29907 [Monosiga brevicollis MX1]|uniref:Fe2OG dioxygenase domain-containing protein n=1 Tax=Monosiga brevicollis TaxID=81824 RepID=A9VCH0_MONBE|nr:uncharacterized protein MONBRDRAFT_29907 [Monosiga brevicollis MX1]EDQ84783.1 predicted protein [Monosiga brevicollis MX1]|eukprot:XP_001750433.1 hypothetical protein [Monosiga brevicollis MX1]